MNRITGFLSKKESLLGVQKGKRRYDLPLDKDKGEFFLKLLIVLMSVLATLAFAAFFTLSAMGERWSSGLENKATIEFPAQDENDQPLQFAAIEEQMEQAAGLLRADPAIETIDIMKKEDIGELVAPWLGENPDMEAMPLPGLISITIKHNAYFDAKSLQASLQTISPRIRVDTHQSWLSSVLRFTGALQFSAVILMLIIGLVMVIAVGGAVQSRIAVHKEEIELLHLIGAADQYITAQFQKHTLLLAVQSALIGLLAGGLLLIVMSWIAGQMDLALLPDFSLSWAQKVMMLFIPALIGGLGMMTARMTVLHALQRMP